MGRSQRVKGNSFERQIANKLKEIFPNSKRGIQFRNALDQVPDVDIPHFYVECKAHKKTNLKAALRQATERKRADDNRMPLAICKDDHQKITITMYFDDFFELIKKFYNESSSNSQ